MLQCAADHESDHPSAAGVVRNDFYMDDCISGASTPEEVTRLFGEVKGMLGRGGFELRKFRSNGEGLGEETAGCSSLADNDDSTVLGLGWSSHTDELSFRWRMDEIVEERWTKRTILGHMSRVFDPHGLVAPIMVVPKLILQSLHREKVAWDGPIPDFQLKKWLRWFEELPAIENIRLHRHIDIGSVVAVHGYSDASQVAYGAVVYLECEIAGVRKNHLVAAKSRVAPLKTISIPRLELLAAGLMVRLTEVVQTTLELKDLPVYQWTDSMVVLYWLESRKPLKLFVHNRVQRIKEIAGSWKWDHVSSERNPADLLSRGVMPRDIKNSQLWWNGPSKHQAGTRTMTDRQKLMAEQEERHEKVSATYQRVAAMAMVVPEEESTLLSTLSSLAQLVTRTAWSLRVLKQATRRRTQGRSATKLGMRKTRSITARVEAGRVQAKFLSQEEKDEALRFWVAKEQKRFFETELRELAAGRGCPKKSTLAALVPFVDGEGILRVSGRLEKSSMPFDGKHPMILPDLSRLAGLIVRTSHLSTLHGGTRTMMAATRQTFWVVGLRMLCKRVLAKCVTCARHKAVVGQQLMGSLPQARAMKSFPFENAGVDYAGPFLLKLKDGRCKSRVKAFVAVFVCMATKAVHLELVEGLSTPAFLAAFQRFSSIRGPCLQVWSDNGTNFVGAQKELKELVNSWKDGGLDASELRRLKVEWNFIAPYSPHQGGLWEAAVKSMKYHLTRVAGARTLSMGEMRTVLAQISAILNSRPMGAMTDDPQDLEVLTPAHFLNGRPMVQLFGPRVETRPTDLLDMYRQLQFMTQQFWKRWSADYLNELQQRPKWRTVTANWEVGDLVLLTDDNQAPAVWRRGRISKVLPDIAGQVRNVVVAVGKRSFRRAVQRLVKLPVAE